MNRFSSFLAAAFALFSTVPAGADSLPTAYDFYPTAVQGSAREVGIGGATVATPKDYSAVFINPAGLAGMTGRGLDFGSDSNNIDNYVVDASNPKAKALNDPLKFSFFGVRFVTHDWGIGIAVQQPYKLNDTFNGTAKVARAFRTPLIGIDQTSIQGTSNIYSLAVAKTLIDNRLAFGISADYIQVAETYSFNPAFASTAPINVGATSDALSFGIGALGRPFDWLDVGAAYKLGWRTSFDSNRNLGARWTIGTIPAFRDGKSPSRGSLGLRWHPSRYFSLTMQSNYTFAMKGTVVVGSNLFPGGAGQLAIGQQDAIDGHWGMEVIPIDEPDLTLKLWAGGYLENTGLQGGYNRYHRTAGFSLQPWFLGLSMAIDDSNLYNNFTVGLGVDLLQVAARTAAKLGYTLPL